jgi:hypothetical protein
MQRGQAIEPTRSRIILDRRAHVRRPGGVIQSEATMALRFSAFPT